jgi:hypothetical protein
MDCRLIAKDDGPRSVDGAPYEPYEADPDPNFANFLNNWNNHKGHIIIFLGAGASVGARNRLGRALPTAYYLRNLLWQKFMAPKPEEFTPDRLSLVSLEHASALVERSVGRSILLKELSQQFDVAAPLWQHAVLPFLHPRGIFTSNYDTLIEQGWAVHSSVEELGTLRPYYRDETPDAVRHIPLYKPHGSIVRASEPVGEGGLVVTQFDYIEMLSYRRNALSKCLSNLQNTCVIFIGYSFQDLDIATSLYDMRNPHAKRSIPWYAVFPRNDENVRGMYDERYGIRQINRTFFQFMLDLDDAVGLTPEAWKFNNIESINGIVKPMTTSCKAAVPSKA